MFHFGRELGAWLSHTPKDYSDEARASSDKPPSSRIHDCMIANSTARLNANALPVPRRGDPPGRNGSECRAARTLIKLRGDRDSTEAVYMVSS